MTTSAKYLVDPRPAPSLHIPASDATVRLHIIDSTTNIRMPAEKLLTPVYKGKEEFGGPAFSFLIEHDDTRLVFDLGMRKNWESLPPVLVDTIKKEKWHVHADRHVAEILQDTGVDVAGGAINAVIWSHHHWDHYGDLQTFPASTDLIVGPGFKAAHLPGYPNNPSSPMHQHDFENRCVREVDVAREGKGAKIGRFHAYDYFGDGSFYLLDTPGHAQGHMCGLARTTPTTFVLLGGDACHHGGEFRPSDYVPLPREITPSPISHFHPACPGEALQKIHKDKSATKPFANATDAFSYDLETSRWTVAGMQEFDAADNVLVIIAHDDTVSDKLSFWPKSLNDWHADGVNVKEQVRWAFVKDYGGCFE